MTSEAARCASPEVDDDVDPPDAGAAGKAAAVWLYCAGLVSLEATAAAFARHPEWRDA